MHFVSLLASTHDELLLVPLLTLDELGQYFFVFSLAFDVFDHHELRCILCIPWRRMSLVEINFVVSLTLDGFSQHELRYILFSR